MKPEQAFYNSIKHIFPGHVQRIETSTGSGVPDVNCCCNGVEAWFELKVQQSNGKTLIRKEQWAWMRRRFLCKGKCFIISRSLAPGFVYVWEIPNIIVQVSGKTEKYLYSTDYGCMLFTIKELEEFLKISVFTIKSR